MALARKGTRIAVVDGHRYRWVVAPDDEPGLAIVVEDADDGGRRMVTWVEHGTVITPALVAVAVRRARRLGWAPRQRGPQFVTRLNPEEEAAAD
ncbi:hypothetical protein [Peterkaempfera griseoplana]|uniref:hypothetical protein n=1 Tax=Peterkaempfera griseoplana TaxID=66896 RepID=UPI0006E43669|nr:hypothetical protein [Peterkaempfera griseoplana]